MKIYSEEHRALAKRDTLFIHGNLASHRWWHPTLAEWQNQGPCGEGSLFFADWRGCGQNPPWPKDQTFSLEDLARDFVQLLDDNGLVKVDVVGHSLGGLIALQMMILAPDRLAKAVLLDPVGARGVVFDDSMYEAFKQMAANPELTKTVILSTMAHSEKLTPGFADALGRDAFKAVQGIGSSVLEILKTTNVQNEASQVDNSVLILHGQHDAVIPLKDSEELARILPNSHLEILPEAAHCWNVENPQAFTRRLREWF